MHKTKAYGPASYTDYTSLICLEWAHWCPNDLAKLGKYGFISIALGVFMAWLFMWIVSEVREQKKSIYDRSFGKTTHAKMLIYDLIIVIYELSQAAFLAWIFVNYDPLDSALYRMSHLHYILVIMAVCAYALSGGVVHAGYQE